jgi:hypothetical protein
MRRRAATRWALVALLPLLLAAADPSDDVAGCRRGSGSGAPDLVEATGAILEQGTSARWTLTFAAPLEVPDRDGHPFRVEVAIRDPDVPALSFAYFRGVNRLVRVDATVEHPTQILLLPEAGVSEFNPAVVEGRTMTIQVPGRTLSEDEDLTGTSPGLEALRWTVVVRDERSCDFLGTGRPTERMVEGPPATSAPPSPTPTPPVGASVWWIAPAVVALAAVGYVVSRRSR